MTSSKSAFGPLQEAWLEALESGKYGQCEGVLSRPSWDQGEKTKYCCLGVGALVVQNHADMGAIKTNVHNMSTDYAVRYVLAPKLRLSEYGRKECVRMNDEKHFSFAQIAKRIRADPTYYFEWPA